MRTRNHWGAVVSIAKHYFHFTRSEDERNEVMSIVAEGWAYGLAHVDSKKDAKEIASYLFACGHGYAKNYLRDRIKNCEYVSSTEDAQLEPFEQAAERHESSMAAMAMAQRIGEVMSIVATFPEKDRQVIEGRYIQGYTLQEMADEMGISRERVRQIEVRGLQRLRKVFNPNMEG